MARRDKNETVETGDPRRGPRRRDFLKYTVALGAALGLPRWKVFEAAGEFAGQAFADELSCAVTNRSVHIISGNGGFSWFQLFWPHVDIALNGGANAAFHDPQNATMAAGTDKPLVLAPESPFRKFSGDRQMSAFMAGKNEFTGSHLDNPTSTSTIDMGKGLFAACATMQNANPTLVPVISVNTAKASMPYGGFAGAPSVANVADAAGMLGLFDSAAASAMGPLGSGSNAAYFEAYYKGFLGLTAAAQRPTRAKGLKTGKIASRLVGVNLSSQLKPTVEDQVRYGLTLGTPSNIAEFGRTLMTTAKAFKLGLTSCVLLPAFNDDPHEAFADMTVLRRTINSVKTIMEAFFADLAVPDPTCAGATIADNLVLSIHGDTPKTPLDRRAWPDNTPGTSNWAYVLGAGWLRTGWYGGILANGKIVGFDPSTGKEVPDQSSTVTGTPVAGAIAYAVAKGDMRRVGDFYRGPDFSGIIRLKIM